MRGQLFRAALLLFFGVAFTQPATAIETWKVKDAQVSQFRYGSVADAKRFVSDKTMQVRFGGLESKSLARLPISSVSILYFKPSGQVLAWSDKTDTVEAGTWEIFRRVNQNDLCLHFPEDKGSGLCTFIGLGGSPFRESTNGNPFQLKAEKPAPYHLSRFGMSLQSIAKKLGL